MCVVGAGVIGAAVTFYLSRLGARVTVVDATARPAGASFATFGWINANGKQPDHYFELNRDGMAAHADLARQLGDESWLHGAGSVEWAGADGLEALEARVESHAARGYPAEMIDSTRLRELEPALTVTDGTRAAYFASEGWADTVALVGLLLAAARQQGARVLLGTRVTSFETGSGDRVEIATDRADAPAVDLVVNCAGPDAASIAALAGLRLQTEGPVGINVVTSSGRALNRVVRSPSAHFRPETGGRVMVAAPAADAELANGADPNELAPRVVAAAAEHLPALRDAAIDEVRVARRAIPADGLPVVGRTAEAPWLYHVVTHSGVTLAPLFGRLVAEEIVNEADHERLEPYRPYRFTASLSS